MYVGALFKQNQFYIGTYVARHDLRCAIASCELQCVIASCDVRVQTHFVETCN